MDTCAVTCYAKQKLLNITLHTSWKPHSARTGIPEPRADQREKSNPERQSVHLGELLSLKVGVTLSKNWIYQLIIFYSCYISYSDICQDLSFKITLLDRFSKFWVPYLLGLWKQTDTKTKVKQWVLSLSSNRQMWHHYLYIIVFFLPIKQFWSRKNASTSGEQTQVWNDHQRKSRHFWRASEFLGSRLPGVAEELHHQQSEICWWQVSSRQQLHWPK